MTTEINDEYLRYWNILDQDESGKPNTGIYKNVETSYTMGSCPEGKYYNIYREYYIDNIKGYPEYIKNIKLVKNIPDISIKPIDFIKRILEELFYKISVKQYLKGPETKNTIDRPNHGSLNHFRSFLFSTYAINIFIKKNLIDFKKYITSNKIELIFLIIASYFDVILRVDESCSPVVFFNTTNGKFENIFVEISKNVDVKKYFESDNKKIYMSAIGSSFLFMSICKYLKKTIPIINENLSDIFIEKIGLGLCMYEESDNKFSDKNLKSIFLIYGLVSLGHTSDHCRGSFSNILDEKIIKFLFKNITKNDKTFNNDPEYINMFKYIILLLLHTEWLNEKNYSILKNYTNQKWITQINNYTMKDSCTFFKSNRYDNPNFITYSKDFNLMYNGIKKEFDTFINFEQNINDMIQIIEKDKTEAAALKAKAAAAKEAAAKAEALKVKQEEEAAAIKKAKEEEEAAAAIKKAKEEEAAATALKAKKEEEAANEKAKISNILINKTQCKMVPLTGGSYKKKKKISTKKIKIKSFKNKLRSKKQKHKVM
jgi:hypothetical protein